MAVHCNRGRLHSAPLLPLLLLVLGCLTTCASAQGAPGGRGGGGGGFSGGGSRSHYSHGGRPGSLAELFGCLGIFVLIVVVVCICDKGRARQHHAPDVREFLLADALHFSDSGLPSGQWRGYYRQFGAEHHVADFALHFDGATARASGSGVDDVGGYTITGLCSESGTRVAFRKQYVLGSLAMNGRPNPSMNKGHGVEYRAERVGPNLGQGIKGNWYISDAPGGYVGSGNFHLWPAMDGWQQLDPSAPPQEVGGHADAVQAMHGAVFSVTEDNICTVCFDRPINACLLPCSHVAVCSSCASRLNPQSCPICRTPIYAVTGADGRLYGTPPDSSEAAALVV